MELFVPIAIIGVVEFTTKLRSKDYSGAITIGIASIVGLAAGALGIAGLNYVTGLIAGLSAVGVHTAVKTAGQIVSK